jgi:hypothetical protein
MFLPQLACIFLLRFLSGEKHHNSHTKKTTHTKTRVLKQREFLRHRKIQNEKCLKIIHVESKIKKSKKLLLGEREHLA